MMSLSKVFRSGDGKMPERAIHFSDVVIEQLVVASSGKVNEKPIKDQELAWLNEQIQDKHQELEGIRKQAEEIVENARTRALELIDQGNQDAEGVKELARQEGWRVGHDDGYAKGLEEANKHVVMAQEVLRMAEVERRERVTGSEPFLIDLAMVAVEQIVGEYVQNALDYIPQLVRTLLTEVERAFKVEVRVAPTDFPSVIHHRNSFERSFLQRVELLILPDRSLSPGDVVIATEYGTVDGRLGTRLEQLHKALTSLAKEWESSVIAESQSE
jgi:flagellar assembly protein FliH